MKHYRTLSQTAPAPAAGQGVVIKPSPVQRVKVTELLFTFATDITVANRFQWLQYRDPNGVPTFTTGSATAIAASSTVDFACSVAYAAPTAIQTPNRAGVGLPLPNVWLPPGWQIVIGDVAEDSGDQYSAITWRGEFATDVWDIEEGEAEYQAFIRALVSS